MPDYLHPERLSVFSMQYPIQHIEMIPVSLDPDSFVVKIPMVHSPYHSRGDSPFCMLTAIASQCLYQAALNRTPENQKPEMINVKVDYVSMSETAELIMEVDMLHSDKQLLSLDGYIYSTNNSLVAKASAIFKLSP